MPAVWCGPQCEIAFRSKIDFNFFRKYISLVSPFPSMVNFSQLEYVLSDLSIMGVVYYRWKHKAQSKANDVDQRMLGLNI